MRAARAAPPAAIASHTAPTIPFFIANIAAAGAGRDADLLVGVRQVLADLRAGISSFGGDLLVRSGRATPGEHVDLLVGQAARVCRCRARGRARRDRRPSASTARTASRSSRPFAASPSSVAATSSRGIGRRCGRVSRIAWYMSAAASTRAPGGSDPAGQLVIAGAVQPFVVQRAQRAQPRQQRRPRQDPLRVAGVLAAPSPIRRRRAAPPSPTRPPTRPRARRRARSRRAAPPRPPPRARPSRSAAPAASSATPVECPRVYDDFRSANAPIACSAPSIAVVGDVVGRARLGGDRRVPHRRHVQARQQLRRARAQRLRQRRVQRPARARAPASPPRAVDAARAVERAARRRRPARRASPAGSPRPSACAAHPCRPSARTSAPAPRARAPNTRDRRPATARPRSATRAVPVSRGILMSSFAYSRARRSADLPAPMLRASTRITSAGLPWSTSASQPRAAISSPPNTAAAIGASAVQPTWRRNATKYASFRSRAASPAARPSATARIAAALRALQRLPHPQIRRQRQRRQQLGSPQRHIAVR